MSDLSLAGRPGGGGFCCRRRGVGVPTLNQTLSTLRFFFRVTVGQPEIVARTAFVREPRKLPVVLSPDEVARLLDAAPGLKYKAALSVATAPGYARPRWWC